MKLSALSVVIASAGLLQVNANPLRLIVVSHEASVVDSNSEPVAQAHPPFPKFELHNPQPNPHIRNGTGCAGGSRARFRMRQKAAEVSNIFRWAVGLPPVEVPKPHHWKHYIHNHHHHKEQDDDDSSETELKMMMKDFGSYVHHKHEEGVQGEHRHHKHHFHHQGGKFHGKHHFGHGPSFLQRLHFSLMQLGVWEGRAVAFVLGCGLGALLRMFWVLAVVSYRTFKGDDEIEETHYIPVLNQQDAEEIFVAPPVYIIDEKAPLKEELAVAAQADESA